MESKSKKLIQVNKSCYEPPRIVVTIVSLEQCIAASSANVIPTNQENEIVQEWEVGDDFKNNLDW